MIELHASSLSNYADCPRRASTRIFWEQIKDAGYELNRFDFRNISANIGTACHSGAEIALNEKNQGQAVQASLDKLSDLSDKETKFDSVSPTINTAQKQTERITKCYYINVAERIKPIYIEHTMKAKFDKIFILSGRPDVITKQIHDFKTGKNVKCQAQIGAYSLLAKSNGIDISGVIVDSIMNTRLDKPQEYHEIQFDMKICERLAKAVIKWIATCYDIFESTKMPDAFPCNNNSMLCSKKWCKAFGTDYCEVSK